MIDTDNYGAAGIEVIWLPAGEPHVKMKERETPHAHIYAKLRSSADVVAFMAVCSALENQGVNRHVFMPYLPGARQDRVQANGCFTAEMFARMFAPAVTTLTAVDIHSNAAAMAYGNKLDLHVLPLEPIAKSLLESRSMTYDALVVPDAGAISRGESLAAYLGIKELIYCQKYRDPDTGAVKIEAFDNDWSIDADSRLLIADDICDGGGTFLQIADQIHAVDDQIDIDLFVTHGIFSQGFDELDKRFKHILTTDSFFRLTEEQSTNPGLVPKSWSNLFYNYIESLTP